MDQNIDTENLKIRTHFDIKNNEWYFSVVDIIGFFTKTSNPNNYWKVQKNRLKIKDSELVTKCNQLKMPSKDGKMYLTDVANIDTISKIISILSPSNLKELKQYLYKFENQNTNKNIEESSEFELLVDAYQDEENIFIYAMIAFVKSEDLFISLGFSEIQIKGKRTRDILNEDIVSQELIYGTFSKTITLPEEIDIEEVKIKVSHGMLSLKIPKINKNQKRIVKAIY